MKQQIGALLAEGKRRAPHGARGLKLMLNLKPSLAQQSRPTWGAWIETSNIISLFAAAGSRPTWGAWIETLRKPPRDLYAIVAPHMGRVG